MTLEEEMAKQLKALTLAVHQGSVSSMYIVAQHHL